MNNFTINSREEALKLMNIAVYAGKLLLRSGSEIYRIEKSVQDICSSHANIDSIEVFSMTTAIFISMKYQGETISEMIREREPSINLSYGKKVSNFTYDFCTKDISYEDAIAQLDDISSMKNYSLAFRSFGAGVTSAFFSVMFGGNINDFISALFIGFIVFFIIGTPKKLKFTFFVDDFLAAFLSSLLAFFSIKAGFGHNIDMIIIGTIMPYVPGISLTIGVRDAMMGDYVSGVMEIIKAIFKALAIAIGVGIVLSIYIKG
ncbi:MAG: threonine/serine exporter family protein [Tissierellia bacterium]|nr:threonine/serine exporter family protein [Tissierellia bacterium]